MNYVVSQFSHPRGWIGRLVGLIMAYENRERNAWAVSLLDVQKADHILEVGFGPGWAIQQMAAVATEGLVAGIDHSDVMVRLARERNAAAVRDGRVELKLGSASALPFGDAVIDKIVAVNSLHHWSGPVAGLNEVRRVLKPGGLFAIVEQPRGAAFDSTVQAIGVELMHTLQAAGFSQVRMVLKPMRPAPSIGVLGVK